MTPTEPTDPKDPARLDGRVFECISGLVTGAGLGVPVSLVLYAIRPDLGSYTVIALIGAVLGAILGLLASCLGNSRIKWLDRDDGVIDWVVKLSVIGAVAISAWKFGLFQETTESMNLTIEHRMLEEAKGRRYVELSLNLQNVGKVRVELVAAFLKIDVLPGSPGVPPLKIRMIDDARKPADAEFKDKLALPAILKGTGKDFSYPPDLPNQNRKPEVANVIQQHQKLIDDDSTLFDPGETHVLRFLVEYTGSGTCVITTRADGMGKDLLWHAQKYLVLPEPKKASD